MHYKEVQIMENKYFSISFKITIKTKYIFIISLCVIQILVTFLLLQFHRV